MSENHLSSFLLHNVGTNFHVEHVLHYVLKSLPEGSTATECLILTREPGVLLEIVNSSTEFPYRLHTLPHSGSMINFTSANMLVVIIYLGDYTFSNYFEETYTREPFSPHSKWPCCGRHGVGTTRSSVENSQSVSSQKVA